ncbi:uncharacterized protein EDB91DRAFT_1050333, partial [Suillus paluster]|uniref:uncharacterized protein n=1 Tax=Suillus paluster TaxID=48578 RepID=UPI001B868EC9
NSTVLTFFAPSDLSEIGGMKCKHICVSPKWRNGHAHKDCVFIITDPHAPRNAGHGYCSSTHILFLSVARGILSMHSCPLVQLSW